MIRRAVYSLWMAPMKDRKAGFRSEAAFIRSTALSLHLARQHIGSAELVTDRQGKQLLIDTYQLPFDSVRVELDGALWGIAASHWSIGKLYACKTQQEPFMHLDHDVFWFKPPPDSVLRAEACFQNQEADKWARSYEYLRRLAGEHYHWGPLWVDWSKHFAYNCGIIGFNRLDALGEWYEAALDFIRFLGRHRYENECTGLIFEQYYIAYLCRHYGFDVRLLTDFADPGVNHWGALDEATAVGLGYTHLVATAKTNPRTQEAVAAKLARLAPDLNDHLTAILQWRN